MHTGSRFDWILLLFSILYGFTLIAQTNQHVLETSNLASLRVHHFMGTGNYGAATSPNDKTAKTVDLSIPYSLQFNSDKTILYVPNNHARNVIGYNVALDKTFLVAGTGRSGSSGDGLYFGLQLAAVF